MTSRPFELTPGGVNAVALAHGTVAGCRRARLRERAVLLVEIVLAYVCVRRAIRGEPITDALTRIREAPRTRPAPARSPADRPPASAEEVVLARHLASAVARTLALLPGDTRCLSRSLVLSRLLARRGIPAVLVIGARSAPAFSAHAWVEHAGRAILPPGDGSFGRLAEL
ncbi:MAG TPA: lasso peptide biosynthesis B2 protein [Solirubrobacteraceae bacterium]|jgi:hypothetical protein|nr:lasso peptide biosynthesis B2 protein [Solirubrobacteraceae bacterium]